MKTQVRFDFLSPGSSTELSSHCLAYANRILNVVYFVAESFYLFILFHFTDHTLMFYLFSKSFLMYRIQYDFLKLYLKQ